MRKRIAHPLIVVLSVVVIMGLLSNLKFANTKGKAYRSARKFNSGHAVVARERYLADDARADLPGRYNRNFNTESYDRIVENPFLTAAANPLSTFSIDVDRASYSNVRRFINRAQRPPADAVRIEELVNYFHYAYPEPSGEHPFSVTTEVAAAPWNPVHRLMRIGLKGRSVDNANILACVTGG